MFPLCVCLGATCVPAASRDQKRVVSPLDLKWLRVDLWMLGTEPGSAENKCSWPLCHLTTNSQAFTSYDIPVSGRQEDLEYKDKQSCRDSVSKPQAKSKSFFSLL